MCGNQQAVAVCFSESVVFAFSTASISQATRARTAIGMLARCGFDERHALSVMPFGKNKQIMCFRLFGVTVHVLNEVTLQETFEGPHNVKVLTIYFDWDDTPTRGCGRAGITPNLLETSFVLAYSMISVGQASTPKIDEYSPRVSPCDDSRLVAALVKQSHSYEDYAIASAQNEGMLPSGNAFEVLSAAFVSLGAQVGPSSQVGALIDADIKLTAFADYKEDNSLRFRLLVAVSRENQLKSRILSCSRRAIIENLFSIAGSELILIGLAGGGETYLCENNESVGLVSFYESTSVGGSIFRPLFGIDDGTHGNEVKFLGHARNNRRNSTQDEYDVARWWRPGLYNGSVTNCAAKPQRYLPVVYETCASRGWWQS